MNDWIPLGNAIVTYFNGSRSIERVNKDRNLMCKSPIFVRNKIKHSLCCGSTNKVHFEPNEEALASYGSQIIVKA